MTDNSSEPEPKRRRKTRWESAPEEKAEAPQSVVLTQQIPQIPVSTVPTGADCRIYVGSLPYEIKEDEVRALFSSFGNIRSIDLSLEPGTTRSKGFCFIEYDTPAAAAAAMAMQNFELAGRCVSTCVYKNIICA